MKLNTKMNANSTAGASIGIRYGDFVVLRHSKPFEGYLAADGLLFGDVYLLKQDDDQNSTMEDCVWEIYVQNQYSSIKEYENKMMYGLTEHDVESKEWRKLDTGIHQRKVLSQSKQASASSKKAKTKTLEEKKADIMNMLRMATINEQRLNEKMMALKVGKPVAFGDLIQLRHVKTNKFLTVNPYTLAKMERENLRITVQSRGDSLSCLAFMPRYKSEKEGQRVTHSIEAIIRIHERPGEFVHLAKRNSSGYTDGRKEVPEFVDLETPQFTLLCCVG